MQKYELINLANYYMQIKFQKLRWQHVWPALQLEVRTAEVLAAVLQPIIWLTNEATQDEFSHYVLPTLK